MSGAFQEVARTTAIFGLWFLAIPVVIATIYIIINYYKNQNKNRTEVKNNVAKNLGLNSQRRNPNRNR